MYLRSACHTVSKATSLTACIGLCAFNSLDYAAIYSHNCATSVLCICAPCMQSAIRTHTAANSLSFTSANSAVKHCDRCVCARLLGVLADILSCDVLAPKPNHVFVWNIRESHDYISGEATLNALNISQLFGAFG